MRRYLPSCGKKFAPSPLTVLCVTQIRRRWSDDYTRLKRRIAAEQAQKVADGMVRQLNAVSSPLLCLLGANVLCVRHASDLAPPAVVCSDRQGGKMPGIRKCSM